MIYGILLPSGSIVRLGNKMASTWRDAENETDESVDISTEQWNETAGTTEDNVSVENYTSASEGIDATADEKSSDDALNDIDSIDVDDIEDGLDDSGDTDTAAIADNSGIADDDVHEHAADAGNDDASDGKDGGKNGGGIRRTIISVAISAFAVGLFAWLYMTFAAGTLSTGQTDNGNVQSDNVIAQESSNIVSDIMDNVSDTINDVADNARETAKDIANKKAKMVSVLPDGVTIGNVRIDGVDNTEKGTFFKVAIDVTNDSGDTIIPSDILFVDENGDSGSVTMSIKNDESDEELTVRSAALDGDCGTTVGDGDTKTVHVNFRFDFYKDGFDDIKIRYLGEKNEYETEQIDISSIDLPDYVS